MFPPPEAASLPPGWRVAPLRDVTVRSQYGLSLRGESEGTYPILRMNCQKNGRVLFDNLQFVDLDDDDFRAFSLERGDILFNRTNSIEHVGRSAIFDHERPAVFASYLVRVSLDRAAADPRFITYFLNWERSQAELKSLASRSVGQANISASKLMSFQIVLPPLSNQERIADALDLVAEAIAAEKAIKMEVMALKRAAMREVFTNGLRGEALKESETGLIPESWRLEPLGGHFSVASGGTPARSTLDYWSGGRIPWVKTTEVNYQPIRTTEEKITDNGLSNSAAKLFAPGTLLMAMYGQGVTRGRVALLEIEAACNQACAAITPTSHDLSTNFLFHWLTHRYESIRQLAHGGQQQNLNLDIVRSLWTPCLSYDEQNDIIAILDAIDRKVALHREKLGVLETLSNALLHNLMTGGIRVSDLNLDALPSAHAAT